MISRLIYRHHLSSMYLIRLLLVSALFVLVGCTAVTQPSASNTSASSTAKAEDNSRFSALAYELEGERFSGDELLELAEFESQVIVLKETPLRLGPIGSAILDRFELSLPGQVALADFYTHLKEESASEHHDAIEEIQRSMSQGRDGSYENPYRAFTKPQAELFVEREGYRVIGSAYTSGEGKPLMLRVTRVKENQRSDEVIFDLSSCYSAYSEKLNIPPETPEDIRRFRVISLLANEGDSAAQVTLGFMFSESERYREASMWLNRAIDNDNGLAHYVLADSTEKAAVRMSRPGFVDQDVRDRAILLELSREHYEIAAEYEIFDSLLPLGLLLLREPFEPRSEIVPQAVSVLERAGDLGDWDASVVHYQLLASGVANLELNQRAVDLLIEAAESDHAMAMYELGNCYARGCLARPNYGKAKQWYRKAIQIHPDNPQIVNSIAWILTVSDKRRLWNPRYALKMMTEMMETDQVARQNPAYIDTWAAAHAAIGDFERAVELQIEAVEQAKLRGYEMQYLNDMQGHLDSFKSGKILCETLP